MVPTPRPPGGGAHADWRSTADGRGATASPSQPAVSVLRWGGACGSCVPCGGALITLTTQGGAHGEHYLDSTAIWWLGRVSSFSKGWGSCFPDLDINRLWSRGRFYGFWISHTLGDFVRCPDRTHLSKKTLCGTLLTKITRVTQCVTLILSGNHNEEIQFFLIHSPSAPVVLGHTWLVKHNPHIDWAHKSILAWSPFCLAQCLGAAFSPVVSCSVLQEKYQFHARSVPFLGFILSLDGIRMDPTKVKAVADWPTPDSRRAVQRFLGFANFYRRFIRNFSQVALPLTDLTSTKKRFCWSSQAQTAFESLKSRFISAPILNTPDPSRQFIVEVDASVVGVGAILSQRSSSDERIHPCAFFSHRLTLTERNYDIGNRELLAVKLALEEWRHWLEGAAFPFMVWTDHKNLEYIRTAKRINSRQARWALFFGRFRFTISYRPGSKNGKPDALSRIFEATASPTPPVAILQPERVVAVVTWGVESKVRDALRDITVPAGCPESLLFVPESVRTSVLQWGHSSSLACHPGATRTHRLIKQRFWWPSMVRDARRFVSACPICAAGKGSNRPPAGLLQPLSVPS